MRLNRREFTRSTVAIHADLRVGGHVIIQGILENVRFTGLLLRCADIFPEQTPCLVVLSLNGGQDVPVIEVQGIVVRHDGHTLAVQFIEIIG